MNRNSIRWRIQIWHGTLLTLSVLTISILFFLHDKKLRTEKLGNELMQATSAILPRLMGPAFPPRAGRPLDDDNPSLNRRPRPPRARATNLHSLDTPSHQRKSTELLPQFRARTIEKILAESEMYFILWSRDGALIRQSDNAPSNTIAPPNSPVPGETWIREQNGYLEAIHLGPRSGNLVVGISLKTHQQAVLQFGLKLFSSTAALIAIGLGIGWWMLGRETAQLSQISESAQRIAHGNLSERITLDKPSQEIASLSKVLNESFMRLEHSFEQQVRFTADASHELRTPVSVILSKGQFALSKKRSEDEYRKAIATCIDSASHMKKMVESLLELARYDSGEATLNLKEVDFSNVIGESVELLQTLADQKRIKLRTTLDPTQVRIDPHRFQQVCINLISNAIKHSPFGTQVSISVSSKDDQSLFVIADEGLGIDEKDIPFLFDRFFKGKHSNGYESERTGLGLAITKAIVLAHGGTIQATNRVNDGALFRIQIPKPKNQAHSISNKVLVSSI